MEIERELREASNHAADVLSGMFEAWGAIRSGCSNDLPSALYLIEKATDELGQALGTHDEKFAAVNHSPIELTCAGASSSVHDAIAIIGSQVAIVSLDVLKGSNPGLVKPNTEYICPPLCCESDLLDHIDCAVESCRRNFASEKELNWLSASRVQELSKAIAKLQADRTHKSGDLIELDQDDVPILLAAHALGASQHVVKSDAVHRKAFPNGEGTMPRNQRKRLKDLGLIATKSGGGFIFTAKGIWVVSTQLAH